MLNNFLSTTPKPQNHLLKQIRDQLEKAKRNMPQRESPNQNSHEISQNYKQKKKALNKSMGINYKDYESNNQDSFSLLKDATQTFDKNFAKKTKESSFQNDTAPIQNNNKIDDNLSKEISNELMKALSLLRNSLPPEFNEGFFKIIMKDITTLLEILNEIAKEATNFSERLKKQLNELETENSLLKTEILDMMKKNQDIVNENNEKVSEIEKLKSQIKKETNDSKAQIILDDKSYLFSMNSLGNSTKHSEELNKLKRFLADLKYENNILKEENNILKIENKKACELIIQQKSQKIIKTFENKVDLIKFTNNQENVAQPEKKMKNNRVALNKFELNEELKLEKTKKFRFVKPKY